MNHALARVRAGIGDIVKLARTRVRGARTTRRGQRAPAQRGRVPLRILFAHLMAVVALLVLGVGAQAMPPVPIPEPIDEVDPINPPSFQPPPNGFNWSVPSRFGQRDANGLIDYHWDASTNTYDPNYVLPASFPVNFNGCQTEADANATVPALIYTWEEMNGNAVVANLRPSLPNACKFTYNNWTSEGTHTMRLTITDASGNLVPPTQSTSPFSQTVTIRDYLIVSIGDSYGSGEGNPDKPQQVDLAPWAGGGALVTNLRSPALWEDERCHRSSYAGAARAALALELESPKTSVTFLSLACSGATINTPTFEDDDPAKPQGTGMLGKYRGAAPGPGVGYNEADFLPAQLEALHDLVGNRQIDALIISIGGNDIGFGNIAAICVANSRCYDKKVDDNFVPNDNGRPLHVVVGEKINALSGKFFTLGEAIHSPTSPWRLNVSNVVLTEYPDPTKGDNADYCFRILHDIAFWPLDMSWIESEWAVENVMGPLNQKLQDAVNRQNSLGRPWRYVTGVQTAFAGSMATNPVTPGHGYCAGDNWIRTASEAIMMQGPLPWAISTGSSFVWDEVVAKKSTKGTLHPTVAGHRIYATQILATLHQLLSPPVPVPPPTFNIVNSRGSTTSLVGAGGWLIGSCVGTTCSSDKVVLTITAQDSSAIRGASLEVNGNLIESANGSLQCPTGMTCTGGLSTDGKTYQWTFEIRQEGPFRLQLAARGDSNQVATITHEVKVDLNNPTAQAVPATTPTADGWYDGPLQVALGGLDTSAGSNVDRVEYSIDGGSIDSVSLGRPITLTTDGPHTITYQAIDFAGRRSATRIFTATVDSTPPDLQCGSPDGIWHASDISIACTATDAGSGLNAPSDASFSLVTNLPTNTETANAATSSRQVCDRVGNCATAGPIGGNKIDKKAPAITLTAPISGTYLLGQGVNANFGCQDGGSGMASCIGTVASGAAIDTAAVGSKTFTVSAVDNLGNAASQSVTYAVAYNICLLYDPTKAHKSGSVAPIKLQLCDSNRANVSSAAIVVTAATIRKVDSTASSTVEDAGSANPDSNFRYDPTFGGYIYNLSTKGLTTGTYELSFSVTGDPVPHTVLFDVR